MNEAMVSLGNNALVLDTQEEMDREVSLIEQDAQSIVIANGEDYKVATEMLVNTKRMEKRVIEYWEPMRKSTYDAYTSVNKHKNQMLDPLKAAEKIIKSKISAYDDQKKRELKEREEAMRKFAEQEVGRKLDEAAEAEAAGDTLRAEYAMAEAEIIDGAAIGTGNYQPPKADGVSRRKTWKITSIDSSKVPISVGGVEIRPVDEKAVLRLIKESRGTASIPGVEFEETTEICVRT
jgi:hypothetical protein